MSADCISASKYSAPAPDSPPPLSTICSEELARQIVLHNPDQTVKLLLSEGAGLAALKRHGRELTGLIKCDTKMVGIAFKDHSNAVTDNPVCGCFVTRDLPVDEQMSQLGLFQGGAANALFELLNKGRHAELLLEEWRRYVFSPSYPNSPFQVDWRAFTKGEQTGRLSFDTTQGCLVADVEAVVDMVGGPDVLREKATKMYVERYGEAEHSPHTPYDCVMQDEYSDFFDRKQEMLDIITEEVTRGDWNTRETRGQLVGATRPWLVIEFV